MFLQFSSYTYSQFIYVIILHYSTQGPNLHFYMEPLIYHAFFYWARLNKMDMGVSIIELRYANHVQISSHFFIKQISLNDWYVKNITA